MSLRAACVAAALGLAVPGGACAEWAVVESTSDYFLEFDPDSVRAQGPFTMAWTRMTFTVPQRSQDSGAAHQSQLQLHAIDCSGSASTVVGIVFYSGAIGRGDAVEQTTRPRAEWKPSPPPPGSLGELTVRLACAELARRKPR
jgi:hypothetical protein